MRQITLQKMINAAHDTRDLAVIDPEYRALVEQVRSQGGKLCESQQSSLYSLLVSGCRGETRAKLGRRVEMPLVLWPSYGIFDRLIFSPDGNCFSYCAGQSYPDEIREVRKLILEG